MRDPKRKLPSLSFPNLSYGWGRLLHSKNYWKKALQHAEHNKFRITLEANQYVKHVVEKFETTRDRDDLKKKLPVTKNKQKRRGIISNVKFYFHSNDDSNIRVEIKIF